MSCIASSRRTFSGPLAKAAVGACTMMVVALTPAMAQNSGVTAETPAVRAAAADRPFDIQEFELVDEAGLEPAVRQQIQAALDAVRGKDRTIADLTGARQSAQAIAGKAGRVLVQIPEQTLSGGRIRVVLAATPEVRIGRVDAQGSQGFDAKNVRASVPALQEGAVLDTEALDRQLRLGALNVFKRTNVTFGRAADGTPTAAVKAVAEGRDVSYLTADNYGPRGARGRIGAGYVNGNLTGRDDTLSLNGTTATDPKRLKAIAASYALPFYRYGQMIELGLARSESDSANTVDMFRINGTGNVASAKWSYLLPRVGPANMRLTAGYLYHHIENNITFNALPGTGSLVPSGSTAPLSLGIEGELRPADQRMVTRFGLNLSRNLAGRLGSSSLAKLGDIRHGAGSFTLLGGRMQMDLESAGGWQLRTALQGQYTRDPLIAADQFNIVGPYAVRGFRDVGILGDKAVVLNLEAATPVLARFDNLAVRGWGFADYGVARRNQALSGELARAEVASAGVGVRANGKRGSIDIYLAHKLAQGPNLSNDGRNTLWLSTLLRF